MYECWINYYTMAYCEVGEAGAVDAWIKTKVKLI